MRPFFITSSGTNVGKTHLTSTLCWQLREEQKKVTALKPIMTGYDTKDENNDAAMILKSCELQATEAMTKAISKWRYSAPLAPNMAADQENAPPIKLDELVAYCKEHAELSSDVTLVEGVGGIMVPINNEHTVLDWMEKLDWPVIMVVGSYLGTVSHTLTAIEVLKVRKIKIAALVVSESANSDVSMEDTIRTFEKFVAQDIPIVKLPRVDKDEAWKYMPRITWMTDNE